MTKIFNNLADALEYFRERYGYSVSTLLHDVRTGFDYSIFDLMIRWAGIYDRVCDEYTVDSNNIYGNDVKLFVLDE